MKLKGVKVYKYKCIENEQFFEVEDGITILVGMNESGKTSILEAIAKSNYFENDEKFRFNTTHDYPRREKKVMEKSGTDPSAIECLYTIDEELVNIIESDVGAKVLKTLDFRVTTKYSNNSTWNSISVDVEKFVSIKTKDLGISSKTLNDKLEKVNSKEDLDNLIEEYKDENIVEGLKSLSKYFENQWDWKSSALSEYISRVYLKPNLPKFLYYDEYYSLPSRISIEKMNIEQLDKEELKTAKALFELADISVDELLKSDDFEDYKAELEATEAIISEELFKYWSSNSNLDIEFDIDKKEQVQNGSTRIVEHILDIRVRNRRARVSLPLKNRSKGFNWFFSFLVWFKKIQEDMSTNYVLLLDEPGLNLHASAQADLLRFIDDLSDGYQVIYTTHSPFMVKSDSLHTVRTVVETDKGSVVSDSVQEKDPRTLFPLQAALGYDIAQNLFVSPKNLLVEGISDLVYLQHFSELLRDLGREFLRDDITIVPVGGLDKVSVFISLLRGSSLELVTLLDSSMDTRNKQKLENLIAEKLITKSKVLFFDQFIDNYSEADIEDMFTKEEYMNLFNSAFNEYEDITVESLNQNIDRVILQVSKKFGVKRYNHYRPAKQLLKNEYQTIEFSEETLGRFEALFDKINSLF